MQIPPLPALLTLAYPPSWLNNAGNLDRSACFEIRLKEVRQLAGCVHVRQAARLRGRHRVRDTRVKVRSLPNEKSAKNNLGRVATGVYELTKHDLEIMAAFRIPRAQAGDHRSARANAMRHRRREKEIAETMGGCGDGRIHDARGKPRWATNVRGIPRDQRDEPLPEERLGTNAWANLLGNGKTLGVPDDWTQHVRLEKWIYPRSYSPPHAAGNALTNHHSSNLVHTNDIVTAHDRPPDGNELIQHSIQGDGRKVQDQQDDHPRHAGGYVNRPALPKYYLICPGVLPDNRTADARRAYQTRGQCTPKKMDIEAGHAMTLVRPRGSANDPRLAPLSDAPLGAKPKGCPQRVRMLLMPLCWPQEYEDAMTAQRWIDSLTLHQRTVAADTIAQLTWRYGILFAPRTMLCRQCLDTRKGTHPETKRRGDRRRRRPERYMPIKQKRKRAKIA